MEIDHGGPQRARAVFVVGHTSLGPSIAHTSSLEHGNLVVVDLPTVVYLWPKGLAPRGTGRESRRSTGALERALENAPALLDVAVTKEAESPDFKNGLAGVPDRQVLEVWDRAEKQRYTVDAGTG